MEPSSGSIYGGSLLTISGENFSTHRFDNPVKVGGEVCKILQTTADKITCRIE